MTLKIIEVLSARYLMEDHSQIGFMTNCEGFTDVETLFSARTDKVNQANNNLCQAWLDAGNTPTAFVEPESTATVLTQAEERRNDRREEFFYTLDKMNSIWYDSLSSAELSELTAWRTAWLDYPTTPSASRPIRLSMFDKDLRLV
jgi:hypothetical protein